MLIMKLASAPIMIITKMTNAAPWWRRLKATQMEQETNAENWKLKTEDLNEFHIAKSLLRFLELFSVCPAAGSVVRWFSGSLD